MSDQGRHASELESMAGVISAKVMVLTIILLAMVMGQLVFAGVIIFAFDGWNQPSTGIWMSAIAVAFAAQMFLMANFVPSFAAKSGVKKANGDITQLPDVYMTKTILGASFVEGAGLLNLVAFMLEHNKWSLAPVLAGIVFLVAMIPSVARITNWIDEVRSQGGNS